MPVYRAVIFYAVFSERLAHGIQIAQIFGNAAHVFGDGHIVVVDDGDELLADRLDVVERLIDKPARHGAVADERDDLRAVMPVTQHAAGKRGGRRGMTRVGGVINALLPLGKTGYPSV